MKTIITATIVIVILVASLGATLMIGAPAVYANQADTEQEAGIASDSNGVPCTFGPNHDKCRAEVSASGMTHQVFLNFPRENIMGSVKKLDMIMNWGVML